jgi:magnesium-transporting ATPase (P-type)
VQHLINAKHTVTMITGDDALTGIAVARLVSMIGPKIGRVMLLEAKPVGDTDSRDFGDFDLKWTRLVTGADVNRDGRAADGGAGGAGGAAASGNVVFESSPFDASKLQGVLRDASSGTVAIAMTGRALDAFAANVGNSSPQLTALCLAVRVVSICVCVSVCACAQAGSPTPRPVCLSGCTCCRAAVSLSSVVPCCGALPDHRVC